MTHIAPATGHQWELASRYITRNHLVEPFNKTDDEIAKTWKQHATEAAAIASTLPRSRIFAVLQRSTKGYWLTEWTTVAARNGHVSVAARRKAAHALTIEDAITEYMSLLSFDSSHYFKPQEGLLGLWARL